MKKAIALLLALTLLLTGCSGKESSYVAEPEESAAQTEQTQPTEAAEELDCAGTDAMPWYNAEVTDFGLGLLSESMETGKNALLSPVSILAALSMTANGAEGETLTQMEAVLGQSKDALNEWYQENLSEDNDYLRLSNALYIKDDPELTVSEAFIKTIEQYYIGENYASDVIMTQFNEYTVDHINQFVEDSTDGMIKNILDKIPENAVMYLINALAFEARWAIPYNEYSVQESVFTTEDGREQTVELMYSEETNAYLEDTLCTGFLKNYEGGRYAFAALLPKEGITVEELVDSLSGNAVADLLSDYHWEGDVVTALPKFQTEFDVEMSEILQAMGMTDAFAPYKADFSELATYNGGNIFLNRVLHKTFIAVGEQGTRAGAATVIEAAAEAAAPEEVKEVILNRPFLYLIWDKEATMPIFMGTFMDAQAEGTSVPADEEEIFYSPAEDPCMIEG